MSSQLPSKGLQLKSLVKADQTLEIFLDEDDVPVPDPARSSSG